MRLVDVAKGPRRRRARPSADARAQIVGERFVYLPDLVCPAEVPPTMAAFKAQQHRWGKGMVQAAKKSLGRILRSNASLGHKLEAALHLTSVFTWPLVALVSVPLPLGIWARQQGLLHVHWSVDLTLFLLATVSIFSFYVVSAIGAGRAHLGVRLLAVPLAMALGTAIGLVAYTQIGFYVAALTSCLVSLAICLVGLALYDDEFNWERLQRMEK